MDGTIPTEDDYDITQQLSLQKKCVCTTEYSY